MPTNVYTVRFVSAPGSTSSRRTPLTPEIARAIASITDLSRPSEKFGTHSTSWDTAIPPYQGAPAFRKSTTSEVMRRIAIGTDSSAA